MCDPKDGSEIDNGSEDEVQESRSNESESEQDFVTSEVNPYLAIDKHIKPLHNSANVVAKLRFSISPLLESQLLSPTGESCTEFIKSDADGDMEVPRRRSSNMELNTQNAQVTASDRFILIEHMNSTTLNFAAHQIWRGAFLLADFILTHTQHFTGKIVLELGSGTGFSSIVACIVAKQVIITDLHDESILGLIQSNLTHNQSIINSQVLIKPLDFFNLSWTQELECLVTNCDVIIAADVVYHDKITDGFIETLKKCLTTGKPKNVFIALEKRYVFTLSELDTVAPSYDYFLEKLESELGVFPHGSKVKGEGVIRSQRSSLLHSSKVKMDIIIQELCLDEFPLYFNYEPSKDLVLWNIGASPSIH